LENEFRVVRKVEIKIMATRRSPTYKYRDGSVVILIFPQPTRLIPQQLEEKNKRSLLNL